MFHAIHAHAWEFRYVKLSKTILNVLIGAKLPPYIHRKGNHMYTVGQHLILLVLRQYEGKSYRRFVEWLHEGFYLRMYLQLVPHYTTFQKIAARIDGNILYRITSSFILLTKIRKLLVGIDASGIRSSNASSYYTDRTGIRKKYIKLSIGAEVIE